MVRVAIEVGSGATRFGVSVTAASVRRALSIAGARYPGRVVKLRFSSGPGRLPREGPAASTGWLDRSMTAA